ncbi:MAG TPA: hypothetical protein VD902_13625 [Symbiobacteriaceae bacterium]|nr:hypothetical protein [Symbiobacteriaceae bacterium]
MPTVNRKPIFDALDPELKKINAALTELNKVMAGANTDPEAGGFAESAIWGENAVQLIAPYMEGLQTDTKLKEEINKLLQGLPGASQVTGAIEAAGKALGDVIKSLEAKANELGNGAGERYDALKHLLTPHTNDPNYTYKPYEDPFKNYQYGLIPAVTDVINAGAGANIDVADALKTLKELEALVNTGVGIADFILYANGTLGFLTRTLKV